MPAAGVAVATGGEGFVDEAAITAGHEGAMLEAVSLDAFGTAAAAPRGAGETSIDGVVAEKAGATVGGGNTAIGGGNAAVLGGGAA